MLNESLRSNLIKLLHKEVKPAFGCTEPIAVALAVAKACELIKSHNEQPARITVEVSANVLKNAMGVGIPGTGMNGLYIASALGACCGKSIYGLEVLRDSNPESVNQAKKMVEENRIEIKLAETEKSLFIKAYCWSQHHTSSVIIENSHDEITEINVDGEIILKNNSDEHLNVNNCSDEHPNLNIHTIFEFATESPIEELTFILESAKLNHAIAKEGLHKRYGLSVGKTLKDLRYQYVFGDGIISYAMALTASAVDARMAGCTLPAMSNSGSGNQGITITLPVLAVFNKLKSDEEDFIRALIISHLVAIHIKSYLGRLSALCGCVVASTGAACGITYLMGGGYEELTYAIKNMIGNITGMVCDGAKSGCALKVSSGTSSAVQSAILAVDKICISDNDGIIENDIETTISNLGKIGSKGMKYTDNIMLNIMINKSGNNKECI